MFDICLPDSSDPSQMTKFIKEVKTCSGRPKKIILERKANWKRKGKDLRRNIRKVLRLAKGTLIHKVGCFSCLWILFVDILRSVFILFNIFESKDVVSDKEMTNERYEDRPRQLFQAVC